MNNCPSCHMTFRKKRQLRTHVHKNHKQLLRPSTNPVRLPPAVHPPSQPFAPPSAPVVMPPPPQPPTLPPAPPVAPPLPQPQTPAPPAPRELDARAPLEDRIVDLWGTQPLHTLRLAEWEREPQDNTMSEPSVHAALPVPPQLDCPPQRAGVPPLPGVPQAPGTWTLEQKYQEYPGGTKTWRYTWTFNPIDEEDTEGSLGCTPRVSVSPI